MDHSRQSRQRYSKGAVFQRGATKGINLGGKKTFSKDQDKGNDRKNNGREKDTGRSSSISEKHGGGVEDASSRDHRTSETRQKLHSNSRKERT